jgi:hypothetical protein
MIPPPAVATWNRRPFLRVRAQHLRLTAAVLLVTLTPPASSGIGPSSAVRLVTGVLGSAERDAPAPTQIASREPPTRPEIPQVSPPTYFTAPPAPASPPPPAAEKPAPDRGGDGRSGRADEEIPPSLENQPRSVALRPSPPVRMAHANRPAKSKHPRARSNRLARKAGNVVDAAALGLRHAPVAGRDQETGQEPERAERDVAALWRKQEGPR